MQVRRNFAIGAAMAAAAILATPQLAAQSPFAGEDGQPVMPYGVIGDPSGTGAHPAVAERVEGLPRHTVYHPVDMDGKALPLMIWGNGGCSDNGLGVAGFLREISSHGYFVVALGYARYEGMRPPEGFAPRAVPEPGSNIQDATTTEDMLDALSWADRVNADPDSPFAGKIDTTRIAVMGHSCGGLQTVRFSHHQRVAASIVFNSGVYNAGPGTGRSGIRTVKPELNSYHAPVAYINGGPTDIAYENAEDDVARINHVPVFYAHNTIGHGGTFNQENGGDYAMVAVRWMDWLLKGDRLAAETFVGADCELCMREDWTVKRQIGQ